MNSDMDVRAQNASVSDFFVYHSVTHRFGQLALVLLTSLVVLTTAGCGDPVSHSVSSDGAFGGSAKSDCTSKSISNRFLVRWKDGTTTVEEAANAEDFRTKIAEPYKNQIEFSETDFRVSLPRTPSRQLTTETFSSTPVNWGVVDSRANEAWAAGATGQGIVVAVVDTGVDETHPELAGQLYVNPNEVPNNGKDDDGNGLIDDVSGYNFASATGKVTDSVGHGTHVSGIIAADSTQGPVQGMAPKAKILPLAFMDSEGGGTISAAILAIQYAQAQGAKIISASWGGDQCSQALIATISDLNNHGILFISAAGNGDENGNGVDIGVTPEYPAAFGMPNQITVGAITVRDIIAGFSNFSTQLVQLVAPGVGIISTYPGGGTMSMDGTSMATPFVSGAAAAIWSAYPAATAAQVRTALISSSEFGNFPVVSGGRLDVANALAKLKAMMPTAPGAATPVASSTSGVPGTSSTSGQSTTTTP